MRPILRPGTHVLRRSARELQVGLDPRHALVLDDRPGVRDLLAALTCPGQPLTYDGPELALLRDNGMLVDSGRLLPLVPGDPDAQTTLDRADAAALARTSGDAAPDLVALRAAAPVDVVAFGGAPGDLLAARAAALLRDAGARASALAPDAADATARADRVGVLVGAGEPHRELLDAWIRAGTPHVLVRVSEGTATVGPFVRPGETACLRCVDAHHTDADPAWPLLVAQHASATARGRPDGVPEPVDSVLATLAVAWAARDVLSHLEGRSPSSLSGVVRLDPHLTSLETGSWLRHPDCGCGWAHGA